MTKLIFLEPQLRHETFRDLLKASNYNDLMAVKMMFIRNFGDTLKFVRVDADKREVFAAAKKVNHPTRKGHFVYEWTLDFTSHTKAMMFLMTYAGDLEGICKTGGDLVKKNED